MTAAAEGDICAPCLGQSHRCPHSTQGSPRLPHRLTSSASGAPGRFAWHFVEAGLFLLRRSPKFGRTESQFFRPVTRPPRNLRIFVSRARLCSTYTVEWTGADSGRFEIDLYHCGSMCMEVRDYNTNSQCGTDLTVRKLRATSRNCAKPTGFFLALLSPSV